MKLPLLLTLLFICSCSTSNYIPTSLISDGSVNLSSELGIKLVEISKNYLRKELNIVSETKPTNISVSENGYLILLDFIERDSSGKILPQGLGSHCGVRVNRKFQPTYYHAGR
jgi:hypothetical protein